MESPAKVATGRPFPPGTSGNPAGRPKGSRNALTARAVQLLDGAADELVEKLIEEARAGKPVALRIAIDRIIPRKFDRTVELDRIRIVSNAGDLVAASAEIVLRAAAGEITLQEAKDFMALLAYHRQSIETHDLEVRLLALESPAKKFGFDDEVQEVV